MLYLFRSVSLAVFSFVMASAGTAQAQMRSMISPAAAQNQNTKKTPLKNSLKISTESFKPLTFDEVGQLAPKSRVSYLMALQNSIASLERVQALQFKRQSAVYEAYEREAYAFENLLRFLMGVDSFAQNEELRTCIYGGHVSQYKTPLREPYNCLRKECTTAGGKKGLSCGFIATGLSGAQACLTDVPRTREIDLTAICQGRRVSLSASRQNETSKLIDEADNYFGFKSLKFSGQCSSVTAKTHFENLISASHDVRAQGKLIQAVYFCKAIGQSLPAGLTDPSDNGELFSITNFSNNFDQLSNSVASLFQRHINNCEQKLTEDDLAKIRNLDSPPRSGARTLEARAQNYLRNLSAGEVATHKNVLEKNECDIVLANFESLKNVTDRMRGELPSLAEGPAPELTACASRRIPTGCQLGNQFTQFNDKQASNCLGCMQKLFEDRKNERVEAFKSSEKYNTLQHLMALACGDSQVGFVKEFNELWTVFGHCSEETYEFSPNDERHASRIKALLQRSSTQWQNLTSDKSNVRELNATFSDLFGISFEDSQILFCGPSGSSKIFSVLNNRAALQAELQNRRAHFEATLSQFMRSRKLKNTQLQNCLSEAAQNAPMAFARNNPQNQMCYSFKNQLTPQEEAAIEKDFLEGARAATLLDNGGCLVARYVEIKRKPVRGACQETDEKTYAYSAYTLNSHTPDGIFVGTNVAGITSMTLDPRKDSTRKHSGSFSFATRSQCVASVTPSATPAGQRKGTQ